jgi:hypothetical protein
MIIFLKKRDSSDWYHILFIRARLKLDQSDKRKPVGNPGTQSNGTNEFVKSMSAEPPEEVSGGFFVPRAEFCRFQGEAEMNNTFSVLENINAVIIHRY